MKQKPISSLGHRTAMRVTLMLAKVTGTCDLGQILTSELVEIPQLWLTTWR